MVSKATALMKGMKAGFVGQPQGCGRATPG
jgi:hypothetical protein